MDTRFPFALDLVANPLSVEDATHAIGRIAERVSRIRKVLIELQYGIQHPMGFLDNLESDLKNLEKSNERESSAGERSRRERERAQAVAAGPFAEELKNSAFTMGLLDHATRIGFGQRMKVNITWLGTTLRLDARERRLELKPTPSGVVAVFSESGEELSTTPVDLKSDPEKLARYWLKDA
jgi:hypothetical protein